LALEVRGQPVVAVGPGGVVGCGRRGGPMARRLLAAGADVRAFDVDERALRAVADAGASVADSPRAAADGAALAVTMLPDPPTVDRAARGPDGLLAGLRDGALWLEMSSSRPATTRALAEAAAERGAALLDAPVSGGVAGAEAGTLTIMLGGPAALVERATPLLEELGRSLLPVGDPRGAGGARRLAPPGRRRAGGRRRRKDDQQHAVGDEPRGRGRGARHGDARRARPRAPRGLRQRRDGRVERDGEEGRRPGADGQVRVALHARPVPQGSRHRPRAGRRPPRADAGQRRRARAVDGACRARPRRRRPHPARGAAARRRRDRARLREGQRRRGGGRVSDQEAQQYLDDMVRERGYVLEYHKRLIGADYEFARAVNDIVDAAYLKERRLDRRTKELCFIVSLVAMRATKAHIQSHIKVALEEGCSPEEILEAIEISMPEAGVVAFQEGFNAWAEIVGAPALEPSVDVAGDRNNNTEG